MAERDGWSARLPTFWNARERRVRAFWRIFGQNVVRIVLFLPFLAAVKALHAHGLAPERGSAEFFLFIVGVRTLTTVLSVAVAARLLDRRPVTDFGLGGGRDWWLDLGFGLGLGAFLMSGIFLVEWLAGWVTVTGTFRAPSLEDSFALALLLPLVLFLCVGIDEELQSRGYFLRNLAEGLSFPAIGPRGALWVAVLVSSTLFGLFHLGNPGATLVSTLNIALAGVVLALPYVLTGRLALSIGLHITWNFFQGNVYGFSVSGISAFQATVIAIRQGGPAAWTGGGFGPEAGLVGVLAMLAGAALILVWVRVRSGSVSLQLVLVEPPTAPAGSPPPAPSEGASESAGSSPGAAADGR